MNKNTTLVVVLVILFCSSVFLASCASWGDPYAAERKKLASELGVKLSDYHPLGFPANYFDDVLQPGMSSEEVHKIVIGYKVVYLCYQDLKLNSELYYYFSTDENEANRFLIVYDENGKIVYKRGEDLNSRDLQNSVHDCKPGRIGIE
jgi:hypothetical protein